MHDKIQNIDKIIIYIQIEIILQIFLWITILCTYSNFIIQVQSTLHIVNNFGETLQWRFIGIVSLYCVPLHIVNKILLQIVFTIWRVLWNLWNTTQVFYNNQPRIYPLTNIWLCSCVKPQLRDVHFFQFSPLSSLCYGPSLIDKP